MPVLPDSTRSDSNHDLSEQNRVAEESNGWNTSPINSEFSKNKKLEFQTIELANEKTSILSIFKTYNINFQHSNTFNGWSNKSICPLPDHHERTPSFAVNIQENRFNCFGCQRGGGPVQFLAYLKNVPSIQIAKELLGNFDEEDFDNDYINNNIEIRKLLFEYADFHYKFLEENADDNASQYAEKVAWTLDCYIRNHFISNSIVLEQLKARIKLCREKLEDYG